MHLKICSKMRTAKVGKSMAGALAVIQYDGRKVLFYFLTLTVLHLFHQVAPTEGLSLSPSVQPTALAVMWHIQKVPKCAHRCGMHAAPNVGATFSKTR